MRDGAALYFVPSQTLSGAEARALGIRSEDDLFGGDWEAPKRKLHVDPNFTCRVIEGADHGLSEERWERATPDCS